MCLNVFLKLGEDSFDLVLDILCCLVIGRACFIVSHRVLDDKVDVMLRRMRICEKASRTVITHLKVFEIPVLVFLELILNPAPTHRVLNDIIIIGDFLLVHSTLEIVIPIRTKKRWSVPSPTAHGCEKDVQRDPLVNSPQRRHVGIDRLR